MKKTAGKIFVFLFSLFFIDSVYGQQKTARQVADEAVKKGSPSSAVSYLQSAVETVTDASQKRALYAFLGSLQETMSLFTDASKSYAKAAGIGGTNVSGMPEKSNEQLVIDAVRCSLSGGDWETAYSYLNSAVRNSKNPEISAKIKLYEQWAVLSSAEDSSKLAEPVTILKAYVDLDSMKSVKPSVLLTLWYLTGEVQYSSALIKEFPKSMEAGIVNGKVMIYPAPFWYFTPRSAAVSDATVPDAEKMIVKTDSTEKSEKISAAAAKSGEKGSSSASKNDSSEDSGSNSDGIKLQLGLFREKANADAFIQTVKAKGFDAYAKEEKRPSGNIYFAVLVDQKDDAQLSTKLKMAGFESYQYSE